MRIRTVGAALVSAGAVATMGMAPAQATNPGPSTSSYNVIVGTSGPDTIAGTFQDDAIFALGGRDRVAGSWGDDLIRGGRGADRLFAGPGTDVVNGGRGYDYCVGGTEDVFLRCEVVDIV